MCHHRISKIDSERIVIYVRHGKSGRDRAILLSPTLLKTLREYRQWKKPRTFLFPGTVKGLTLLRISEFNTFEAGS